MHSKASSMKHSASRASSVRASRRLREAAYAQQERASPATDASSDRTAEPSNFDAAEPVAQPVDDSKLATLRALVQVVLAGSDAKLNPDQRARLFRVVVDTVHQEPALVAKLHQASTGLSQILDRREHFGAKTAIEVVAPLVERGLKPDAIVKAALAGGGDEAAALANAGVDGLIRMGLPGLFANLTAAAHKISSGELAVEAGTKPLHQATLGLAKVAEKIPGIESATTLATGAYAVRQIKQTIAAFKKADSTPQQKIAQVIRTGAAIGICALDVLSKAR